MFSAGFCLVPMVNSPQLLGGGGDTDTHKMCVNHCRWMSLWCCCVLMISLEMFQQIMKFLSFECLHGPVHPHPQPLTLWLPNPYCIGFVFALVVGQRWEWRGGTAHKLRGVWRRGWWRGRGGACCLSQVSQRLPPWLPSTPTATCTQVDGVDLSWTGFIQHACVVVWWYNSLWLHEWIN